MAQPDPYAKTTDFAEYQTAHQSAPFNGALLDAELVDIQTNLDDLNTNIGLIQRDDGALANQCVTIESLSEDTLALIEGSSFAVRGAWATATLYALGDIVAKDGVAYICIVEHTSGTFATDYAAEKWVGMSAVASQTDANFQILGSGDASKIARFEVDGFTTATTRTFTLPNASCTLAALEVAQTWTANQVFSANVTLGDASGDTLTINAGTWTLGSNALATYAIGAAAAGVTNSLRLNTTFSGHSGGTTQVRGVYSYITASGGNAISAALGMRSEVYHSGSATMGTARALTARIATNSTGALTSAIGGSAFFALESAANITTAYGFHVPAPSLVSTGAMTTFVGFRTEDIGHATLVTNSIGFNAADQTGSVTLNAGFRGQLSAGTGKYNLYMDGTAQNYLAGVTGIGVAPAATVSLNVFKAWSDPSSIEYALIGQASIANTSGTPSKVGVYGNTYTTGAWAGGAGQTLIGVQGRATHAVGGTLTNARSVYSDVTNTSTGTITSGSAFHAANGTNSGGGTITTLHGFHCGALTVGGTNIAFRGEVSSGANKYNLYMDGTANNSFAGPIYPAQDTKALQTAAAIYAGSGAPNNANGSNGDFYLRGDGTVAGNTVVYHKEGGSWTACVTA